MHGGDGIGLSHVYRRRLRGTSRRTVGTADVPGHREIETKEADTTMYVIIIVVVGILVICLCGVVGMFYVREKKGNPFQAPR